MEVSSAGHFEPGQRHDPLHTPGDGLWVSRPDCTTVPSAHHLRHSPCSQATHRETTKMARKMI
jgi:hypothetical protein